MGREKEANVSYRTHQVAAVSLDGVQVKKTFNISLGLSEGGDLPSIQYGAKGDETKIKDLSSWLRAWTAFSELQCYFCPQLVPSLIRYQSIVTRYLPQQSMDHVRPIVLSEGFTIDQLVLGG